ncbi:MAG: hypothetical protein WA950_22420 [Shinella sp.]
MNGVSLARRKCEDPLSGTTSSELHFTGLRTELGDIGIGGTFDLGDLTDLLSSIKEAVVETSYDGERISARHPESMIQCQFESVFV